jgi:hypothetical protein
MTDSEVEQWRRDHDWQLRWNPNKTAPTLKSVPNGKLKIMLPQSFDGARSTWTEGVRGGLETKFESLFREIDRRIDESKRRAAQWKREQEERERLEELRRERERTEAIERLRAERLAAEVARWRLAEDARAYADSLRSRLSTMEEHDRERVEAWCEWIEKWCERADPTANVTLITGLDVELGTADLATWHHQG